MRAPRARRRWLRARARRQRRVLRARPACGCGRGWARARGRLPRRRARSRRRGGDASGSAELDSLGDDLGDQLLGLAAGGAVADGDDADLVLADQVLEEDLGLRPAVLGRVRVDHALVEQVAAAVEHRHLAAGPEPGVDRQHDLLGDRRLKQQAAQVLGEDLDGVLLGHLGQVAADLALHAGQDQAVEGVDRGGAEELGLGMALERKLAEEQRASRSGRETSSRTLSGPSLSPRLIARTRCGGIWATGSE